MFIDFGSLWIAGWVASVKFAYLSGRARLYFKQPWSTNDLSRADELSLSFAIGAQRKDMVV